MTHQPALPALACMALLLVACDHASQTPAMSGYAEADLVYVASPGAGTLRRLAVQRGQRVEPGQPLYALDADAEALAGAAARARSERAKAQEQNLRKARRPAELRAVAQQLAQAQAALAGSSSALERNRRLVDDGFVAPIRLEELVAARDRDAARVREVEAQLALATQGARPDEIAAAAAEVTAAEADAALADWQAGEKQRSAPVAGQVFDVMYRPGEWVAAGAPVVALLPAGALKLRFFVPEPALSRAAVGQEVRVGCDGCPENGLRARIRWISPQAEFTPPVIYSNSSRSKLVFMVEAVPVDAYALKPGQPVDVRFLETPA
ncbi:HlyD family efflux transporter periplasmic adaptor subunit [Schlegelella sp. S2-27]|uniref:HlyD family efflux transporter periplasmic adaptor subunit n=1 Tax=Caldimonas mangrovi TaxID=2944811 RepID=A0ABT0YN58_9BURK|nr:HlyD family efflux transporter periplasmic adaptor subunit [Caldimonas mangrovi]MCM5679606.1 HlyD family efflux transporter periplasmic adaptor subunit [Caldimonas mangrovi]